MAELSPKRARFVQEYLIDYNGSQAAIRAGYSANGSKEQASRLLTDANVKAAVEEGKLRTATNAGITVERIRAELAKVAFGDGRKLFTEEGNLKPISEIDDETAASLGNIDSTQIYSGTGEDRKLVGVSHKVKRYDKVAALHLLGKDIGMFIDKSEIVNPVTMVFDDPTKRPADYRRKPVPEGMT